MEISPELAVKMDNLFWLLIGAACTSALGLVVWLIKDHFKRKEERLKTVETNHEELEKLVALNKEEGQKNFGNMLDGVSTKFETALKEHAKEIKISTEKLDKKLGENTLATMALQIEMKHLIENSELAKKLKKDYDILFQKFRDAGWKLPEPESNKT